MLLALVASKYLIFKLVFSVIVEVVSLISVNSLVCDDTVIDS